MTYDTVLDYWLTTLGPDGWYAGTPEIDAAIRSQFQPLWQRAMAGGLTDWLAHPRGALAYLILTDQMPRNMFRGTRDAYATDGLARLATAHAIARGWDLKISEPERQFFYLPLEHSESLADQERAVRLMAMRLDSPENLLHAQAHREVIRRFGRFPFRNPHLARRGTAAENAFLEAGGYSAFVKGMRAA